MTTPSIAPQRIPYLTLAQAQALLESRDSSVQDRDAVLAALLTIWQTIFDRPDITESDDFFLLGGHSLKALQLQVHVRSALDYEMDLRLLFDAPTVGELADTIAAHQASTAPDQAATDGLSAGNHGFHLRLAGLDTELWERCANQVVERHEALRALLSTVDGAPKLRLVPYQPFALSFVDLSKADDAEREAERRLIADLTAPFDLSLGPLYRFGGYQTGSGRVLASLTLAPNIGSAHLARSLVEEMLSLYQTAAIAARPVSGSAVRTSDEANWNEAARECIVPLNRRGNRPPIFLVAGGGGGAMNMITFVRAMSPDQPAYGIQAKGYSTASRPLQRIDEMAAYYVEAIRSVQPTGPYFLFGYSFGGIPAFEMAQLLHAQGESVQVLGILDTWLRQGNTTLTMEGPGIQGVTKQVVARLREMLRTPPHELPAYLNNRWRRFRFRTAMNRDVDAYQRLEAKGKAIPPKLMRFQVLAENAMRSYSPQWYPGKIVLFQAQDHTDYMKTTQVSDWQRVAGGGLEIVAVPGTHGSMLHGKNAPILARAVEPFLPSAENA